MSYNVIHAMDVHCSSRFFVFHDYEYTNRIIRESEPSRLCVIKVPERCRRPFVGIGDAASLADEQCAFVVFTEARVVAHWLHPQLLAGHLHQARVCLGRELEPRQEASRPAAAPGSVPRGTGSKN